MMAKCGKCGQEVVLARVCPYCGAGVSQNIHGGTETKTEKIKQARKWFGSNGKKSERKEDSTTGRFMGAMDGRDQMPKNPVVWVSTFLRYLRDPSVPLLRKLPVGGMVAYLIWPLDIITDIAPVLGWVDDAAVVTLLWRYVSDELSSYYRERHRLGR